jgi:hypothetical protein
MVLRAWILWTAFGVAGVALYTWRLVSGWYGPEVPNEWREASRRHQYTYFLGVLLGMLVASLLGPIRLALELAQDKPGED